jgi:solute carrier family 25 S-adenosylmethionine transporter 26
LAFGRRGGRDKQDEECRLCWKQSKVDDIYIMDNHSTFFISLVSGGAAGTATDLAFFPIDTLKTRLQAKGGFFINGGFRGLYKGLGSAVVASAPSASLFFVTYDNCKRFFKQELPVYFPSVQPSTTVHVSHMLAASMGEIAACLVRVPAEVIKQRTQSLQFNSSLESFKFILSNKSGEGILKGLYRGWSTTIMREIPFTIIQFPLYEHLKSMWADFENVDRISPLKGALCGSIAGGFAAAVTTPLDVLKTRLMLSKERIGVVSLFKNLVKEEGYKVLFSGIGPRTMWISAGGAIFLGVYETVSSFLRLQN